MFKKRIEDLKVIPVAKFTDEKKAIKTAELLLKHEIDVLEITMRSPNALSIVKKIRKEFPDLYLGAGTVLSKQQLVKVVEYEVNFAFSPGFDKEILFLARSYGLPFFPGIATPSELIAALKEGCDIVKFYPAQHLGGIQYLKGLIPVFAHTGVIIFPSGGITPEFVKDYLSLNNVIAVGMSYLVDPALIETDKWDEIESRIATVSDLIK